MRVSITKLIGVNSFIILGFMVANSLICPAGFSGGECVKKLDNKIFVYQMVIYLILSGLLIFFRKVKWPILAVGFLGTIIFYIVAATVHSITKAGIFG